MVDRILIGNYSGRQLFRVSGDGYNATDLASPSVFSSDGDYLKIHHIIDEPLTRISYSLQSITRYAFYGTWAFPDLGYIPFSFQSIVHETSGLNGRIFFPGDNNPATQEARNDFSIYVSNNRVWCGTFDPVGYAADFRFRMVIFKNPANMVIT